MGGLGNPEPRYAPTRHNIGFMVVDQLARHNDAGWHTDHRVHGELALATIAGAEVVLAKPMTYMNRSGVPALALLTQAELPTERMLVVVDDFLLDFGRLRFRRHGSDGGHNGLASGVEKLRSTEFPRLRCGIGGPADEEDVIDYVLSSFGADEEVDGLVERSCAGIEVHIEEGIEAAMNRFNGT